METTEKTTSRVDSAGDVLSGKLKDLLAKKENVVIQVESDCIIAEAARKMRDNKVWSFDGDEKRHPVRHFYRT